MQIFLYIDNPELDENEAQVISVLQAWVTAHAPHAAFIHLPESNTFGVQLHIKAAKQLNQPLADMYALAKQYHCEFVVGFIEDGQEEEVCFFGHEEGKPDAFEIGCYLGFE